ncbi:uncharacterized protein LOC128182692 [Crassostrea angulata]|nr:uncharacterized protein LOC128182692 [Crassostrea angulata]|eukprot:XP_011436944.1 PREDICTED: uncharacterized protein LOC105334990 [Crassostrea gigas]
MADRPQSTHSSSTHVSTAESQGPPSHQQWSAYRGPVLFTGPDGLTDQRVKTRTDFQMVGNGDRSPEVTSQMGYLSRPPPGTKFPKAKNGQIGEIGWPVETFKIVKGI